MLRTNALTTVARLAGFMEIDVPTVNTPAYTALEAAINAASNFIEKYTGVTFKKTTYTQEEYDTERSQILNLKHFPILSSEPFLLEQRTSSINEDDWQTVDGQYYEVDLEAGIVMMMGAMHFLRGRRQYRVTYTAGYDFDNSATFLGDTAASDVELATWLIAQDIKNSKGRNMNVKSEKLGDYSVTYAETGGAMFSNSQALAILDAYGGGDMVTGVLTPTQSSL